MKPPSCVFARVGLNGPNSSKYFKSCRAHFSMKPACKIYDQTSIQRNWSKVKLCCAVLLGLGIKGVKITRNVVKVGMHTCLSNEHPNLWSNYKFQQVGQKWNSSPGFARVWLKGGGNNPEHGECWRSLLSTKWASKSMIKF